MSSTEKREKKGSKREINKIINERTTVTAYIYPVTVARVKIYTILEALMWSISGSKCVKRAVFCILQDYPRIDVDAFIVDSDAKNENKVQVYSLKHKFSVFKYYTHFHTLFHPHVFPHMFLNNKTHFFKHMYQTPHSQKRACT